MIHISKNIKGRVSGSLTSLYQSLRFHQPPSSYPKKMNTPRFLGTLPEIYCTNISKYMSLFLLFPQMVVRYTCQSAPHHFYSLCLSAQSSFHPSSPYRAI